MNFSLRAAALIVVLAGNACRPESPSHIGRFDVRRDLFLAHFDSKTDVDDLQSVAGVATVLSDPRFAAVRYHAVAGAYGVQDGLYVPANGLFDRAFGSKWSDAHRDFDQALREVVARASDTLDKGGSIWIAEAGQSDFSAALVRSVASSRPDTTLLRRIHIVQHSDWNEEVTTADDLAYLKQVASYHRIPDGNTVGNGSPGFRSERPVDWRSLLVRPQVVQTWEMAIEVANRYNGREGRYTNEAILGGGLDFSDVAETCWIFGFEHLRDAEAFFTEFGGGS